MERGSVLSKPMRVCGASASGLPARLSCRFCRVGRMVVGFALSACCAECADWRAGRYGADAWRVLCAITSDTTTSRGDGQKQVQDIH